MFSKIVATPFVLGMLLSFYLSFETGGAYGYYLVFFAVLSVIIYLFSPQLDWWWYKRYPPDLAPTLRFLLAEHHTYYKNLPLEEKKRFRVRTRLYMIANEFKPMGGEDVPEDIKAFIAASVVQLTFGKEDYLLNDYEHIIVYPNPFPSPQYPERFHPSEIYKEDGVILFSGNYLMQAAMNKGVAFHIGLYEYAKIFIEMYPDYDYPTLSERIWEDLEQISGISKSKLDGFLNIPDIYPMAVAIHHFFQFSVSFKNKSPNLYQELSHILNQDPANIFQPVLTAVSKTY